MSTSIPSNGDFKGITPRFIPTFHMDSKIFKDCEKESGPSLLLKVFSNSLNALGFFIIWCL
jgi:hypothetical protein